MIDIERYNRMREIVFEYQSPMQVLAMFQVLIKEMEMLASKINDLEEQICGKK